MNENLFYILANWMPFCTAFVCCIFLLWAWYRKRPVDPSPQILLLAFLITVIINWFCINLIYHRPTVAVHFIPLFYLCVLLNPILFYQFVHKLTCISNAEHFSRWHYFLPLLIFVIIGIGSLLVPYEVRLQASTSLKGGNSADIGTFARLLQAVSLLRLLIAGAYCVPGLLRIRRYRKAIFDYSSDEARASLHWLNILVVIFFVQVILPLLSALIGWGQSRIAFADPFLLIVILLIVGQDISLTYNVLRGNYVTIDHETGNKTGESESSTYKRTYDIHPLKERLEAYLEKEKPYLNPELRILDLTIPLQTNRTHLSYCINEAYQMNFCRFINNYRLSEFECLRADIANQKLSNLDLVIQAGFSSYKTYQRTKQNRKNSINKYL